MTPLSRDLDLSTEATISRVVSVPAGGWMPPVPARGTLAVGETDAAATGWEAAADATEGTGAVPTGDFSTYNRGTALSAGAAAGASSAGAGAGEVFKTFNLGMEPVEAAADAGAAGSDA